MAAQDDPAPSGLFGIFLLTIYSLLLIPYTLYRLCSAGEVKTQAAVKVGGAMRAVGCVCFCLQNACNGTHLNSKPARPTAGSEPRTTTAATTTTRARRRTTTGKRPRRAS
jgi:hypothetical protein